MSKNCLRYLNEGKMDEYHKCISLSNVVGNYVASGGGGNPFGDEAYALVLELIGEFGFRELGEELSIPAENIRNPNDNINIGRLLEIVDSLRDLGELPNALIVSDMITSLLAAEEKPNLEFINHNVNMRARILNGLGQRDQALYTLEMGRLTNRIGAG